MSEGTPPGQGAGSGRSSSGDGGTEETASSLDPHENPLLRHPIRQAIVEQLRRTPGLNKHQLQGKLDLLPNRLRFHLKRLREAGIVATRSGPQGNEVLCFLEEQEELWRDDDLQIMFGRRSTRDVGLYLAENPGASTVEFADALNLAPVTVRHHLRTLERHEMVRRLNVGRSVEYHPTQLLTTWHEKVGDRFPRPWATGSEQER